MHDTKTLSFPCPPRSPRLAPLAALSRAVAQALALGLSLGLSPAQAHDTWFEPLPAVKPATLRLALGTGDRFPVQEFRVGMEQLQRSGCRAADGRAMALQHAMDLPHALVVEVALDAATSAPATCWAQTQPHDIELPASKVAVYLQEIQAPATVHEAWAAQQREGQPWVERYSKNARIELGAAASGATAPRSATGLSLDALLEVPPQGPQGTGQATARAGDRLRFQVLSDGAPLPGLAVELRSERSAVGLWRRTDSQGRVDIQLPWGGRWVLRGTDLHPPTAERAHWESRFVTLAFELGERAPLKTAAASD